ncbi:hypothetical protein [Castellaniella defragrans]|uniref:hypothetical protein n=1 Tax=Castellaniella defragrans TaxID=75697 RepID=UPI002AFFA445|nr:hypothetical protein [Castellaniella defragrans]
MIVLPSALPLQPLFVRLAVDRQFWRPSARLAGAVQICNVPLSCRPGEPGLPFSAMALPGRYFADLVARARAWPGPVVILSPAWRHTARTLECLLAELSDMRDDAQGGGAATGWTILYDYADRALAYALPPPSPADGRLDYELRWLSTTDAPLDALLFQALGLPCRLRRVRLPGGPPSSSCVGLPTFPHMLPQPRLSAQARLQMLGDPRAGGQTSAVIPFHAGDVLLAAQVLQACGEGFTSLLVHEQFADVARAACTRWPVQSFSGRISVAGRDPLAVPSAE